MDEASIANLRRELAARSGDAGDGVWQDNVATVEAFLAASTQWRTESIAGGMGPGRLIFIGLDYAGARAGIEAAGIALTPELWDGVQVMEAAARAALNGADR